jgi:predicted transcriptional regulator
MPSRATYTGKKILISLPPAFHEELKDLAIKEHRTFSDLARQALRDYKFAAEKRAALLNGKDDHAT